MNFTKFFVGTHFFGSASPLNFWDTYRQKEVESTLGRMKDDGFNLIILLIPWALFQPNTDPISYSNLYFERLNKVFDAAKKMNFTVAVRLGYTWEAHHLTDPTVKRYREYYFREDLSIAWKHFNKTIFNLMSQKENFGFAFLTWEDFYWPLLIYATNRPIEDRISAAKTLGFRAYAKSRFTLAGINRIFGCSFSDWGNFPIPTKNEPLYELYLNFYNNELLNKIVCASVENFPGIRFELRVDTDWIQSKDGKSGHYYWPINHHGTYSKVVYYHANIGLPPTKKMTLREGVGHLRDLLQNYCRMSEVKEEKVFVDQFNFADNTFAQWAAIEDDAISEFLRQSYELFKKYATGYAVWGYTDWRKDIVFNGAFELGDLGWSLTRPETELTIVERGAGINSQIVTIRRGGKLTQKKPQLNLGMQEEKHICIFGRAVVGSEVTLSIGEKSIKTTLPAGDFEKVFCFGTIAISDIEICVISGHIELSKVQLYDRAYSQGLRSLDGKTNKNMDSLRELNKKLNNEKL